MEKKAQQPLRYNFHKNQQMDYRSNVKAKQNF